MATIEDTLEDLLLFLEGFFGYWLRRHLGAFKLVVRTERPQSDSAIPERVTMILQSEKCASSRQVAASQPQQFHVPGPAGLGVIEIDHCLTIE